MDSRELAKLPSSSAASGPMFRSGAVARLANMPVATLRIWEQRYAAVRPTTAKSGHRLYSPADVQRVLLLRQLTQQGHAIGSMAALDTPELQQVARQATSASDNRIRGTGRAPVRARAKLRLVVIGPPLAARLQRPAVARHLAPAAPQVVVFDSLDQAALAGGNADLLLWYTPELRPEVQPTLTAAQQACRAAQVGVVYRFAGSAATRALADAGVSILRDPVDDDSLGNWLALMQARIPDQAIEATLRPAAGAAPSTIVPGAVPPRRYDDATLTAIAGISPTLACECPRHVAELLMQMSSFEAYSAGCINRDSSDASLHAYLNQVAAASRAMLESALERVARHEGLALG